MYRDALYKLQGFGKTSIFGAALAEFFMYTGRHTLVIYDDSSKLLVFAFGELFGHNVSVCAVQL